MPASIVDGNSPGVWIDGELRVFTSTGNPMSMRGPSIGELQNGPDPVVSPRDHYPLWIEAVWRDDEDGSLYAWYHHEPGGVCGGSLSAPKIGALVSHDGGETFTDLGIVLESGASPNCAAKNGFFATGHGDFSVILDQNREYFYFLFTNYGGPEANQGIAIARMAFADRANPAGTVYKFHDAGWDEPGIGGTVTPIFKARVSWVEEETDSFWGPAVHWNVETQSYVMLLNRSCCEPGWPQEGIYLSFGFNLADPTSWIAPVKLLDASRIDFAPAYYPAVFGEGYGETDTLAGQMPRLFIKGVSEWFIQFTPYDPESTQSFGLEPNEPRDETELPFAQKVTKPKK